MLKLAMLDMTWAGGAAAWPDWDPKPSTQDGDWDGLQRRSRVEMNTCSTGGEGSDSRAVQTLQSLTQAL